MRGRGGKNVKRKKEREDLIKEGEGERGLCHIVDMV